MEIIKFYEGMRNASSGLPEWDQLHPQHQHMIVQAVNLLLSVCHDYGVTGKTPKE